jgi:hypothetical protein
VARWAGIPNWAHRSVPRVTGGRQLVWSATPASVHAAIRTAASGERGLVWLVGMDANDEPKDDVEESLRAAMESRRGHTTVRLPSA